MKHRILKLALWTFLTAAGLCGATAQANDMPTAAGSPIAGISFDDRPLLLPVQRNFQMAMLTVSSELGRSCGRMEAYGWRMEDSEQGRVNQIFNNTVDRMRAQGYAVEAKTSSAVSRDVTLFTADRTDRHLIFLWSAGEIGLVMVLCETSAPLSPIPLTIGREPESAQPANLPSTLPMASSIRAGSARQSASASEKPVPQMTTTVAGRQAHAGFSPVGSWTGDYTCSQGTSGATLKIDKVKGDQFEGSFAFYPTVKNPYVPRGKYLVFGEYDAESQRILINPGKWIERPKEYYNTIMIGSFDPVNKSFSGYFQGITGCTSFEAKNASASLGDEAEKAAEKAVKKVKKPAAKPADKKTVKKTSSTKKKDAAPEVKEALSPVDPAAVTPAPRDSALEPPVGIAVTTP